MNDTGNPVGTTDPARVEVLIDIDNGTVFTAGGRHGSERAYASEPHAP